MNSFIERTPLGDYYLGFQPECEIVLLAVSDLDDKVHAVGPDVKAYETIASPEFEDVDTAGLADRLLRPENDHCLHGIPRILCMVCAFPSGGRP